MALIKAEIWFDLVWCEMVSRQKRNIIHISSVMPLLKSATHCSKIILWHKKKNIKLITDPVKYKFQSHYRKENEILE